MRNNGLRIIRDLIGLGVLAALLGLNVVTAAEEADIRPNILFILADDLGWNGPSCYGNRDVATPNIDRIAKEGMRFKYAYADAQCSPSRAAFLSGQYGARTGLFDVISNANNRPLATPTRAPLRPPLLNRVLSPEKGNLARMLRNAGYVTGISGKWHVADAYMAAELRERDGGRYFDRYGFDFCGLADEKKQSEDKATTAITDDVIRFIRSNRERPWFAFVSHFTPHVPFHAPPHLVEKYVSRGYRRSTSPVGRFSERPTAEYLAMIDHLDANVGRLLHALEELNLQQTTMVVFGSDNGGLSTVCNLQPLREGKGSSYEGGVRVPLIVRWPGVVRPDSVSSTPMHTVDFYPTFMEIAKGMPIAGHKLDGRSLVPVLRGANVPDERSLFWHLPTYNIRFGRTPCAIVRRGSWKLVHWFGDYLDTSSFTPDDIPYGRLIAGARVELFDLNEDEGELRNLAAEMPGKVAELKKELESWWRETNAQLPQANSAYDADVWWKEMQSPAK